jgi:hypothetical protein
MRSRSATNSGGIAGPDLDQRALARAIFADRAMDCAAPHRQIEGGRRAHAAEMLAERVQRDEGRGLVGWRHAAAVARAEVEIERV